MALIAPTPFFLLFYSSRICICCLLEGGFQLVGGLLGVVSYILMSALMCNGVHVEIYAVCENVKRPQHEIYRPPQSPQCTDNKALFVCMHIPISLFFVCNIRVRIPCQSLDCVCACYASACGSLRIHTWN